MTQFVLLSMNTQHSVGCICIQSLSSICSLSPEGPRLSSWAGWPGAPNFPCCHHASWKIRLQPPSIPTHQTTLLLSPHDASWLLWRFHVCPPSSAACCGRHLFINSTSVHCNSRHDKVFYFERLVRLWTSFDLMALVLHSEVGGVFRRWWMDLLSDITSHAYYSNLYKCRTRLQGSLPCS